MRHLVKKGHFQVTEADLALVESVLFSGLFIFVDLFFLSLILTIMTYTVHLSVLKACIIFLAAYSFGTALYYFLKRWLGD